MAAPVAQAELVRKTELEARMLAAPGDRGLRASYFDLLINLAVRHTGLLTAHLPEVGTPLYFRAATPDVSALASVFRDEVLAFEARPTPRHIVVVGAYAGYSTIDLARRYPHARLLAAEPLVDNFRLLVANTVAWPRIQTARVAVWHNSTRLSPEQRLQADWTVRMIDQAWEKDRVIPARSMPDLLDEAGWHHTDMVVVDAAGAEREIFADTLAPWLESIDIALLRIHEQLAPGSRSYIEAALHRSEFQSRRQHEMELFVRTTPRRALPPTPTPIPVIRNEAGLLPFSIADAPSANFGFFVFDGTNCQLHPNMPGQRPARAFFQVVLAGHTLFTTGVSHAGKASYPVQFTAMLAREDGVVLARAAVIVEAGESSALRLDLPPMRGQARLVLQTEMAPGAPNNAAAWARWLEPKLT